MYRKRAWRNCPGRSLPQWEELPDLELYMDQVLSLVGRYLPSGEDKGLTASMVNNYVKQKVLPPPVNKRYGRGHLVALLMLCTLKSVMPISAVQQLFESWGGADGLEQLYADFRQLYSQVNSAVAARLGQLPGEDARVVLAPSALASQAAQSLAMELLPGNRRKLRPLAMFPGRSKKDSALSSRVPFSLYALAGSYFLPKYLMMWRGQMSAQWPHWTHFVTSTTARLSLTTIASAGHSRWHFMQPMQPKSHIFMTLAPLSLLPQAGMTFGKQG
ncbi:MAG: DUF1836 domain-containing protein [Oscillospiraceae bacterium]